MFPRTHVSTDTSLLISELAGAAGVSMACAAADRRDADCIAAAMDVSGCDLLITTGGSGVGRTDATVAALARRGEVIAHGIALQPGHTAAVGRIGSVPVIVLPGATSQALAVWWTLALPVLQRLAGHSPQQERVTLPLTRKIASQVGMTELVLLERVDGHWSPLATGDLSLAAIARADAWLAVPGAAEGFAAETPVDGYVLRD